MTKGSEALMDATIKYMEEHKDELKNEEDIALHGNRLGLLVHYCYDMSQEIQNCIGGKERRPFAEKTGKSHEYMDHLVDRLNKYGSLNNWISSKVPENLNYIEKDKVSNIVVNQIQVKHLLEMIEKGEPNMESQFLDFQQSYDLKVQMFEMPEIKDNMRLGATHTKDSIKIFGNIMNGKFIREKQLDYVIPEYTMSAKEEMLDENEIPNISKGQQLSSVLMSGEEQVVATDVPLKNKMGQLLGELESKREGFRGKSKDNSNEFNNLLKTFDEIVSNLNQKDITDEKRLENLAQIKKIAGAYILAKREQKGYTSKSIPDKEVDKKMLGLIKGGKSIFTTRGKERYAFAERLIGHAMNLENAIKESQMSKEQKEAQKTKMKDVQNKEMKENVVTNVKPKVQPKETQKRQKEEMEMDDAWEL